MSAPETVWDRGMADQGCDIRAHLPFLRACAQGDCLEIGVRFGVSTAALLLGLEEHGGHLWSIDIANCNVFPGHSQWTFVQGDSRDRQLLLQIPQSLDLLFVDGEHSYPQVHSDLSLYGPLVRRGGLILMHDADLEGFGVRQALEEYAAGLGVRPEYHSGSYGLGILRIPHERELAEVREAV